jgi:hypothetical protein
MATIGNSPSSRLDLAPEAVLSARRLGELGRDSPSERAEVRIINDPTLMMQEMAEELGFMKAEELAGSQELEGDEEQAFEDLVSELIRESLRAQREQPEQQQQNRQDAESARARLIQMQLSGRPSQQLDDLLRRYTGGSSQKALAIMAELVRMADTDPDLRRLGFSRQALEDYALAHEAGLVAALNIAGALASAPGAAQDSAQRILGLYEDSVAASHSVLQTFQKLGQSEGISTIADWRAFLTEAVAADLAKQHAGGEKVHLQLILQELKGFRTFNTLTQGLERLGKHLPRQGGPNPAHLMQTTLDYVDQPVREFPRVESWVTNSTTERQILFFQGFRNLLNMLPDDAYASVEQKSGLLTMPQRRVDELTFSQDA